MTVDIQEFEVVATTGEHFSLIDAVRQFGTPEQGELRVEVLKELVQQGRTPIDAALVLVKHLEKHDGILPTPSKEPDPINWGKAIWIVAKIAQVLRFLF